MLNRKFIASAVATIATAGAIGVAIAQTTTPSVQQPNPPAAATSETTTDRGTMTTQSGAGSTVSAEAAPRADRN